VWRSEAGPAAGGNASSSEASLLDKSQKPSIRKKLLAHDMNRTPSTGRWTSRRVVASICGVAFLLAACSGPKPILYPNAHYQSVGADLAQQDIADCRKIAEAAGASPSTGKSGQVAGNTVGGAAVGAAGGAVGGAVVGAAGRGSAIGAASGATMGLLRGLFRRSPPSRGYMNFVDRCLTEKGYEPVGWE
jgi:hypothetical protein